MPPSVFSGPGYGCGQQIVEAISAVFPFDKIKIDRSFVKEFVERTDCVAIVRAISGLGRSLNVTTTAEGARRPTNSTGCAPKSVTGCRASCSARRSRRRGIAGSFWCAGLAGSPSRRGFRQGRAYLRVEQHSSCCSAD